MGCKKPHAGLHNPLEHLISGCFQMPHQRPTLLETSKRQRPTGQWPWQPEHQKLWLLDKPRIINHLTVPARILNEGTKTPIRNIILQDIAHNNFYTFGPCPCMKYINGLGINEMVYKNVSGDSSLVFSDAHCKTSAWLLRQMFLHRAMRHWQSPFQ